MVIVIGNVNTFNCRCATPSSGIAQENLYVYDIDKRDEFQAAGSQWPHSPATLEVTGSRPIKGRYFKDLVLESVRSLAQRDIAWSV